MMPLSERPFVVVRATGFLVLLISAALSLPAAGAMAHTEEQAPSRAPTPDTGTPPVPEEDPARGLTYDGLERGRDDGPCEGLFEIRSEEGSFEGCTHGPDPAPAGVDVREARSIDDLAADASAHAATPFANPKPGQMSPALPVPCIGDGTSGNRVQAIYAQITDHFGPETTPGGGGISVDDPLHSADRRWVQVAPLIRGFAAEVDQVFDESAQETGGERHVRFVTDGPGPDCKLLVDRVVLPSSADDSFGNTKAALQALGPRYRRSDRKYLVLMDSNRDCANPAFTGDDPRCPKRKSADICGIGDIQNDDSAYQNKHDGHASIDGMYARVDPQCWGTNGSGSGGTSAEAHELMHNLGGVQPSAPNATWGWHCIDEADLMCYDDDGNPPGSTQDGVVHHPISPDVYPQRLIRQDCPASHEALFDCNHDDYYHARLPVLAAPGDYELDRPVKPYQVVESQAWLAAHWNTAHSSFLTDQHFDRRGPEQTPPDHRLLSPVGSTGRVSVEWKARDPSGIRELHLWKQTDGGAWSEVTGITTASLSGWVNAFAQDNLSLTPGHRYKFAVRAVDWAGNSSRWTFSDEFKFYVIDETSPTIAYTGSGWSSVSSNNHLGAGAKRTNIAGDQAILSVYGTSIAWVGTAGAGFGSGEVYLDGQNESTFSGWGPSDPVEHRMVLFQQGGLKWQEHTLTIRATGGGSVDIDGFVVEQPA
jgi:hypothetical protein